MSGALKLVVNKQRNPLRCEVCHQADYFNPVLNYCARCDGVATSAEAAAYMRACTAEERYRELYAMHQKTVQQLNNATGVIYLLIFLGILAGLVRG